MEGGRVSRGNNKMPRRSNLFLPAPSFSFVLSFLFFLCDFFGAHLLGTGLGGAKGSLQRAAIARTADGDGLCTYAMTCLVACE